MTRRRGITMFICQFVRCKSWRMTLLVGFIVFLGISESRGDGMMGGHLDNNEERPLPAIEHRSVDEDDETIGTSVVSSRISSLDDIDPDFDLEFDLLAEQSAIHPTRTSVSVSSSSAISSSDDEKSSSEESETAPRYRVLPYAFNGGHPFSLEKDPITGKIDFEKAPPLKALEYSVKTLPQTDENITTSDESPVIVSTSQSDDNPLGPNDINLYTTSFHDFLNLPIRYTNKNSEKYPLISNSYANTKVQSGGNSYNTYNHKKYHEAVKASVDIKDHYVEPSRKTFVQTLTRPYPSLRPSTVTDRPKITTTSPRTTTGKKFTIITTTSAPESTGTTIRHSGIRKPSVTTWKPQQKPSGDIYGIYGDYEATLLPIERLQQEISVKKTTTEKIRYASTSPRPNHDNVKPNSENNGNKEYDDIYDDDYDHILQIATRPPPAAAAAGATASHEEQSNDSQHDDYTYSAMDFFQDSRPVTNKQTSIATTLAPMTTASTKISLTSEATTTSTAKPITMISTSSQPTTVVTTSKENHDDRLTTPRTLINEEKRVTSMPIDTIVNNDNYRLTSTNYGNNAQANGNIDNSITSVTSNNIPYKHNRPSGGENYYPRPGTMGMQSGGIVVKSTSNVVVPPGQDTVSFVLGNRQSVGSVSDAGSEFYGIHSPSTINDGSTISFGKIPNSRPNAPIDNFSGQMIVSAGIGVGSNPIGPYHQRPSTSGNSFDHAVVTVGMPTVDVVNPSESGTTVNANNNNGNKNSDSSTNSLDNLAQKWWASTSSSANNQQQNSQVSQESTNQQFGYRVVFPNEKGQISGFADGATSENTSGTPRPVDEHVIIVHESDIGNGNTLHLDLSSQTAIGPTTDYYYETTTQRLPINLDDKLLPELSESLTPPAERPNILPSGIQRPSPYNYYHHQHHHHQSHSTGNSRPNDYRDQRLPQRLPIQSQSSASSSGFKRRPLPSPPSSTIESNLPNILPQFRPNAKTSHGHNRGETIGTIPAASVPSYGNTRIRRPASNLQNHNHHHRTATSRRPSSVPSHLQRLNPPPRPPPPPPITSLRLPTPASLIASPNLGSTNNNHQDFIADNSSENRLGEQNNRLHKVTVGVPPSHAIDERHNHHHYHHQSNGFGSNQQIKSRLEDNDDLERFSAEPPSRPAYFTKRTTTGEHIPDGMPRIATLQMIQQQGGGTHDGDDDDEAIRTNLPPPYRLNGEKNLPNRRNVVKNTSHDETEKNFTRSSIVNRRDDGENEKSHEGQQQQVLRGDYVDAIDSPVYIVYPVKGALDIHSTRNDETENDDDASVVIGTYGNQRPLPPDTLLNDSNDNESVNLSVMSENSYGSSSLINVSPSFGDSFSGHQLASDFPYPLERPDPSLFTSQLREKPLLVPSEQQKNPRQPDIGGTDGTEDKETDDDDDAAGGGVGNERDVIRDIERDASVNVIPYLQDHLPFTLKENAGVISATLHRLPSGSSIIEASSTPIAYVYTPTARTTMRRHDERHSSHETGPVLLPSQQPSSSSSSAPSPQSFMAPFVASASAEAPTKNGWSVVTIGQSTSDDSTSAENRRRHEASIIVRENEDKRAGNIEIDATREVTDNNDDDKMTSKGDKKMSNIDRNNNEETSNNENMEKIDFDVESFTPQLFGGFKPIFEFPSDSEIDSSIGDKVSGDAGDMVERPRSEIV